MALGRKAHAEFVQARGKELLQRLNNSTSCAQPG
jgi:hypothetical protein